MEKELKFKKEWFDVLNRCSLSLRAEVMEAVFQYFFTGAEPDFEDEARMLAFGFIRADIDATRSRREKRRNRQEKTVGAEAVPARESIAPPTYEEKNYLCSLIRHWNDIVEGSDISPVRTDCDLDSETYAPALLALRRLPYKKIYDAVARVRTNPAKPGFAQFFNSL